MAVKSLSKYHSGRVDPYYYLLFLFLLLLTPIEEEDKFVLKEPSVSYNDDFAPKMGGLRGENTLSWDMN